MTATSSVEAYIATMGTSVESGRLLISAFMYCLESECNVITHAPCFMFSKGTFRLMLRISLTMKRKIQNASYRLFINNESTSLTMSVSTYRLIVSELRSISRNVPLGT